MYTALAVAGILAVPTIGIGSAALAAMPSTMVAAVSTNSVDFGAATRGFGAISKGDAFFSGNESEGSAAIGGSLTFNGFQFLGHADYGIVPQSSQTGLLVGGTVKLPTSSGTLNLNNGGQLFIGDMTNLKLVGNADQGGVIGGNNRALVASNGDYNSTPRVHVNGSSQAPNSVSAPGLFNQLFGDTFAQFQQLNSCLAAQPTTDGLKLHDVDQGNALINAGTSLAGKKIRLELAPGKTNIWTVSASELNSINEIGFYNDGNPSQSTPLVINVTGSGTLAPTLLVNGNRDAGLRSILWNLSGDITLSGSRPLPGTFFAPSNALKVNISNNVEGQLIGQSLNVENIGEQHTHLFWGTISCGSGNPTPTDTPTGTPTSTPTPTDTPTTTPTPTSTPTNTPTPSTTPSTTPMPSPSTPAGGTPSKPSGLAATGGAFPMMALGFGAVMLTAGIIVLVTYARRRVVRK